MSAQLFCVIFLLTDGWVCVAFAACWLMNDQGRWCKFAVSESRSFGYSQYRLFPTQRIAFLFRLLVSSNSKLLPHFFHRKGRCLYVDQVIMLLPLSDKVVGDSLFVDRLKSKLVVIVKPQQQFSLEIIMMLQNTVKFPVLSRHKEETLLKNWCSKMTIKTLLFLCDRSDVKKEVQMLRFQFQSRPIR